MSAAIRLVLGLGNPGTEYSKTRHNAGFWYLELLAEHLGARLLLNSKLHAEIAQVNLAGERLLLAKPTTFMNRSGLASQALLNFYKLPPESMLVVHDELDLSPGTARLKFDGGHGGQNGLRDISAQLGHGKYHRLRIGIGHPGHKDQVTPWVLGRASVEHERQIRDALSDAVAVLPALIAGQVNDAMKRLHTPKT